MSKEPARWERLIELTYLQRLRHAVVRIAPAAFLGVVAGRVVTIFVVPESAPWIVELLAQLGFGLVALAASVPLFALVQGDIFVDFEGERLRVRRTIVRFDEVNVAALPLSGMFDKGNGLTLRIGVFRGLQMSIALRRGPKGISPDSRERVLTVVRASNIAMPPDSHDPKGAFARFNFPENLTKEAAIELVLNQPAPGDRLPIG